MTVKNAIQVLDALIECKQDYKTRMLSPEKPWNREEDGAKRLARAFAENLQSDVESLQAIKRQLLPEQHRTKIVCKHLKKYHDIDGNGQKYCTGCNMDL